MLYIDDTIAAIATAPGKGGIGIVRVSGKNAHDICFKITHQRVEPRKAYYLNFYDKTGQCIDKGIVLFFQGPNSYTGEDVVEFQGHGGPIILDILLNEIVSLGTRIARAGEFTERAYMNDKIDLNQVEAISDLINASSTQAAKSAIKSLQGEFSRKIDGLLTELISTRVYIEAAIDFPEEEIDFLADSEIKRKLVNVSESIRHVFASCQQGVVLREGISIVLAGKPNVGKSSLLNALSGKESAIVTNIEGTTRDTLTEYIHIDGVPIHFIDTAGLRVSDDIIESEGIKRAIKAIKNADHILLVTDITKPFDDTFSFEKKYFDNLPNNIPITHIYNKVDLSDNKNNNHHHNNTIYISAKTGLGIEQLKEHILKSVGYSTTSEGVFTARTRHIDALKACLSHLNYANEHMNNKDGELIAEELKLAQLELSKITGTYKADDLLGEIFSNFCIGK